LADKGEVTWGDNIILDGSCTRENLELSSQRIEHQDHPNSGESETKRHGEKWMGTIGQNLFEGTIDESGEEGGRGTLNSH
jgi:hypothetical protein